MQREERQLALLNTPLGQPGSGRLRYGAAMYFHQQGRLDARALEAFRMAAASDTDDVRSVMGAHGIDATALAALLAAPDPAPGAQLFHLLDEIDRYLQPFTGPGIAEARTGIATARAQSVNMAQDPPANCVVGTHLPPALAALAPDYPALAANISATTPLLLWETYADYAPGAVGEDFEKGHAFTSLIGANAPLYAEDFDLGLFLIAPDTLYRDHCHPAPELYAPLTGPHLWRFGVDAPLRVKPAHEPVWNQPNAPHMTKSGPVPFLCIFCWAQNANAPAHILPANDWDRLATLDFLEA